MTVLQTICDNCGAVKGKTNHWWVAYIDALNISISLEPLESLDPDHTRDTMHLCGEVCVFKMISNFMHKDDAGPVPLTSDDSDGNY